MCRSINLIIRMSGRIRVSISLIIGMCIRDVRRRRIGTRDGVGRGMCVCGMVISIVMSIRVSLIRVMATHMIKS